MLRRHRSLGRQSPNVSTCRPNRVALRHGDDLRAPWPSGLNKMIQFKPKIQSCLEGQCIEAQLGSLLVPVRRVGDWFVLVFQSEEWVEKYLIQAIGLSLSYCPLPCELTLDRIKRFGWGSQSISRLASELPSSTRLPSPISCTITDSFMPHRSSRKVITTAMPIVLNGIDSDKYASAQSSYFITSVFYSLAISLLFCLPVSPPLITCSIFTKVRCQIGPHFLKPGQPLHLG